METFRNRLLHSLAGDESNDKDIPGATWPYKSANDEKDWEAIIEGQNWLMENLVDDGSGTGRMKWKDE